MNIKYEDYLRSWLTEKKQYVKYSTYANYLNNIESYIIPELGEFNLNEIDHKVIQNFIVKLTQISRKTGGFGLSSKTIKDVVVLLKSTLITAINDGIIPTFDMSFKYPKEYCRNDVEVMNQRYQKRLIRYLLNNMSYRNLGILLSLFTGLRIGEICALTWDDFNFTVGTLTVNKTIQRVYLKNEPSKIFITPPKTSNSHREIPLSKELFTLCKTMKLSNSFYVLSGKDKYIEPRTYRRYFEKVLRINKIPHMRYHSLRHTFATNCINLGTNYKIVSELLGHSSINITLNLYVHPDLNQKKKCIELLSKTFIEKV